MSFPPSHSYTSHALPLPSQLEAESGKTLDFNHTAFSKTYLLPHYIQSTRIPIFKPNKNHPCVQFSHIQFSNYSFSTKMHTCSFLWEKYPHLPELTAQASLNIFWNLKWRWHLQFKHHTFPDRSLFKCCGQSSMKPHYSSVFIKSHLMYGWHSARCMSNEIQDPAFRELTISWKKQTHWCSRKFSHGKRQFANQFYTDC